MNFAKISLPENAIATISKVTKPFADTSITIFSGNGAVDYPVDQGRDGIQPKGSAGLEPKGGALYCRNCFILAFWNTTVGNNTAFTAGGGFYVVSDVGSDILPHVFIFSSIF